MPALPPAVFRPIVFRPIVSRTNASRAIVPRQLDQSCCVPNRRVPIRLGPRRGDLGVVGRSGCGTQPGTSADHCTDRPACNVGAERARRNCGRGAPASTPGAAVRIVAVVNGDVISNVDVDERAKLFALSTGQPLTPDVLDRLRPQIRRQLVDERMQMQEIQRRHIIIQDKQIADAIRSIETRNGMPAGALRQKLASDGIGLRTLVDQIRTQLGWIQVVREQLGTQVDIPPAVVAERQRMLEQQTGKPEYRVAEIFIPIDDPTSSADAQRFADTVITQLRAGAPFSVAASQFSQSQAALEGGELGWVQPNQLDPQVAQIVAEMPEGAVSNPIKVPGGWRSLRCRASARLAMTSAPLSVCARCSCRSRRRSIRRSRPRNNARRWTRRTRSSRACIAAIRWKRWPKKILRRARSIRGHPGRSCQSGSVPANVVDHCPRSALATAGGRGRHHCDRGLLARAEEPGGSQRPGTARADP